MKRSLVVLALALAVVGSACSSSDQAPVTAGEPAAPGDVGGGGFDGDFGSDMAMDPDGFDDETGAQNRASADVQTRQVILTAGVDLVVDDAETVSQTLRTIAEAAGGFISSANLYRSGADEGAPLRGTVTVRVPSEALQDVLDQFEDLAVEVRGRELGSEDVTTVFADLDARLDNLRAYEIELRALLTEVREKEDSGPDELLFVFDRLTEVRGEIEQIESRRMLLNEQVQLATIRVTLTPSSAAEPISDSWSPTDIVRDAARALVDLGQGIGAALIWFGIFVLPIGLAAMLILGLGWRWYRGRYPMGRDLDGDADASIDDTEADEDQTDS